MGGEITDLLLVNTQDSSNRFMKYGRLMSGKFNLASHGKSLATKGTLYNYEQIANIVKVTQSQFS